MNLQQYFQSVDGVGIFATADAAGKVDLAIYEKPQIVDEATIAFNMTPRLSYQNLQSNPHAAYMFIENSMGWNGKRLYLTKLSETPGPERVKELRTAGQHLTDPAQANKYYVRFSVDDLRPAVGDLS